MALWEATEAQESHPRMFKTPPRPVTFNDEESMMREKAREKTTTTHQHTKKRKGGVEKLRERKRKALAAQAAKSRIITQMFSCRGRPGRG